MSYAELALRVVCAFCGVFVFCFVLAGVASMMVARRYDDEIKKLERDLGIEEEVSSGQ